MNQFLRNLTAEQQVSALFIIVFGLLFLASATVFMLLAARARR
jgi:phosphatidate cytidylyltransferase